MEEYEVQTGGGGAGQGGHPARDEQSDVVGRKREVVNNTAKQRERSDSVSCQNKYGEVIDRANSP